MRASFSCDPNDQDTDALAAEHRLVIGIIEAMIEVSDMYPDEACIDQILTSIMANMMLEDKRKPVKWLSDISNLAFQKRNAMWQDIKKKSH